MSNQHATAFKNGGTKGEQTPQILREISKTALTYKINNGGGLLAWHAQAERHRPTDPQALAREAQRLASMGLTPQDVAAALRIDLGRVHCLLNQDTQTSENTQ